MGMTCPRCQVSLSEVARAGVVADTCGTCRGLWLDRDELLAMAASAGGAQRSRKDGDRCTGAGHVPTTRAGRRLSGTGESGALRCPRCGDVLCQTQRHGARVDECRRCRGVWLDDGELERVRASLRDQRSGWEWDEEEPGIAIRWDRAPRYPRFHSDRSRAPQAPRRERSQAVQWSFSPRNGDSPEPSTNDAESDENTHGPRESHSEPRSTLGKIWSACRPTIGTLLIVLGLFLMLVPVLPGTPLIFIGMAVAGSSHPVVRFLRERWRRLTKSGT